MPTPTSERLLPNLVAKVEGGPFRTPKDLMGPREHRRLDRAIVEYEERKGIAESQQVDEHLGW